MGVLPSASGIVHRSFAFVNGLVIGTALAMAVLTELGVPAWEMLTVAKMAGVGALVGSLVAGFKWLAGISGGITGGLIAVALILFGTPPLPGVEEWLAKYLIVAFVVPLLPTVGGS